MITNAERGVDGAQVLVACPDSQETLELCGRLRGLGWETLHASSPGDAMRQISSRSPRAVFCTRQLAGVDGVALLAQLRDRWPEVRRVLVAEPDDGTSPIDAVNRAGIHYCIQLPCGTRTLEEALGAESDFESASAVSTSAPTGAPSSSRRTGRFEEIIGESQTIVNLLKLVERVAKTSSTVLVTGETGTGKELIGHALHEASERRKMPFAAVNSAAIPETLLESELFGHRRGAFTGATSDNPGLLHGADGGTVFLDEVGEMPLTMQAKLLRFLQTGEVRAVGSRHVNHVDVRLVAATNRRLEDEVQNGNFREDLYYRLAVIPIHVPPLRDRPEDVPLLARYFVSRLAKRYGRPNLRIGDAALDALTSHAWPGNVRELENVIEHGAALSTQDCIQPSDLPIFERRGTPSIRHSLQSLSSVERKHIIETLEHVGWNRKRAAEILQISTTTLWRRLKEFGIDTQAGRPPALSPEHQG